jgi:hypothetical protein
METKGKQKGNMKLTIEQKYKLANNWICNEMMEVQCREDIWIGKNGYISWCQSQYWVVQPCGNVRSTTESNFEKALNEFDDKDIYKCFLQECDFDEKKEIIEEYRNKPQANERNK